MTTIANAATRDQLHRLEARAMSEATLQDHVIDYAHDCGWLVQHTRPALTKKGWRTPLQGDAGFPDLVLARNGRVIFAELKAQRGIFTARQLDWWAHLPAVREWRPSDWLSGAIRRELA